MVKTGGIDASCGGMVKQTSNRASSKKPCPPVCCIQSVTIAYSQGINMSLRGRDEAAGATSSYILQHSIEAINVNISADE